MCEICGRSFDSNKGLATHIRFGHEGYDSEKYHKKICSDPDCYHEFCKKQNNENYVECEKCGNKYDGFSGIAKHLSFFHEITGKDYYLKYLLNNKSESICNRDGCSNTAVFKTLTEGFSEFCGVSCASKRMPSEKTKERMSESHKGKEMSENHCRKISESLEGRTLSEDHIRATSEGLKGREFSDEHKQKIRESKLGRKNPMYGKEFSDEHVEKIRKKNSGEDHPQWKDPEFVEEFNNYCRKVNAETRKWKDELDKMNVDTCYYCGVNFNKYIKENQEMIPEDHPDSCLVTIDHKIPKIYGFENDIDPEIIGHINNLEVCCKSCNSSKQTRTESEFVG